MCNIAFKKSYKKMKSIIIIQGEWKMELEDKVCVVTDGVMGIDEGGEQQATF